MLRRSRVALGAISFGICVLALLALVWSSAASDGREGPCTKVAAPGGKDSATGDAGDPYATPQRLADSLAPGDTGCLRGGKYWLGGPWRELIVATPGIRLTSYPGERATLVGRIILDAEADGVRVDRLTLDGRNRRALNSPTINGDDVVFRRNNISSPHSGGCFILGSLTEVRRDVIKGNRIHNCGEPATLYGHGIYMQDVHAAKVVRNTIYDNADTGIKVGPDSDGALIRGNVIDGNPIGVNFTGDPTHASSRNVVTQNVIANATRWWNVQFYWLGPIGSGNLLRHNCVHPAPDSDYNEYGGILTGGPAKHELERRGLTRTGFIAEENLVAEPDYVDSKAKDFRLRRESRCRAVYGSKRLLAASNPRPPAPGKLMPLAGPIMQLERLIEGAISFSNSPWALP